VSTALRFAESGSSPPANHWRGMPEYVQADLRSFSSLILQLADGSKIKVHFRNDEDHARFEVMVGSEIFSRAELEAMVGGKCANGLCSSIWFPPMPEEDFACMEWVREGKPLNPRWPLYVVSKSRWKSRFTVNALEKMHVPYRIVVEPQEYDNYAAVINPARILQLPSKNFGKGSSVPARNWVWQHSIDEGHERHWIIDDNIEGFYRLHRNEPHRVESGAFFRILEDFVDRYENVALAGCEYQQFLKRRAPWPVFRPNTRIYSCILIKNDLPLKERWRGIYNEDTDLSIRALKDGWCAVLFNAFNIDKCTTGKVDGGNQKLYAGDGRLVMAQSLRAQHPDVVRVYKRFGRYQHHVDYSGFKNNQLKLRRGVVVPEGVNNFGLVLRPRKQIEPTPKKVAETVARGNATGVSRNRVIG
jgi:hypothetical protein